MSGVMFGIALITFVVIVLPIWIVVHYAVRWRAAKTLSAEDERVLAELHRSAERLEGRVQTLERILDAELPHWRQQYERQ